MKIAIIGAGAAGLYSCLLLVDKGYTDITVYEITDRVGGTVESVTFNGKEYDNGPHHLIYYYSTVHRLLKRFGFDIVPVKNIHIVDQHGDVLCKRYYLTNYANGQYKPFTVIRALLKYRHLSKLYKFDDGIGFADIPIDSDLTLSVTAFLKLHQLDILHNIFHVLCRQTEGEMDQVPIAVFMRLVPWNMIVRVMSDMVPCLGLLAGAPLYYPSISYNALWATVYQYLLDHGVKFQFNCKINGIYSTPTNQHNPGFNILYVDAALWYISDKVIIACNNTIEGTLNTNIPNYWRIALAYAWVLKLNKPITDTLTISAFFESNQPQLFERRHNDEPIYSILCSCNTRDQQTVFKATAEYFDTIHHTKIEDVLSVHQCDLYTLNLDTISSGIFNKYKAAQGINGIYYVNNALTLAYHEHILRHVDQIVGGLFSAA